MITKQGLVVGERWGGDLSALLSVKNRADSNYGKWAELEVRTENMTREGDGE